MKVAMEDRSSTQATLIEYARHHGLAVDHLAHSLIADLQHESTKAQPFDFSLIEAASKLPEEKLQVTREAAKFLSTTLQQGHGKPALSEFLTLFRPMRNRKLKIESPLLKTDHAEDVRKFGRRHSPSLATMIPASSTAHVDSDEATSWRTTYQTLHREWKRAVDQEKLDCPMHIRELLPELVGDDLNIEDKHHLFHLRSSRYRVCRSLSVITLLMYSSRSCFGLLVRR